jgi:flagellar hook-length control protein FliK
MQSSLIWHVCCLLLMCQGEVCAMNMNLITVIDAIVAGTASIGLLQSNHGLNKSQPALGSTENSENLSGTVVDETYYKINNNDCAELNTQTSITFPQTLNEAKAKGLIQSNNEPNKSETALDSTKDNTNLPSATVEETSYKINDNSCAELNAQSLITFTQSLNEAEAELCICSDDKASSSQEQSDINVEAETLQQNLPEIVAHKQGPISLPPALLASLGTRTNQDTETNGKIFFADENGQIESDPLRRTAAKYIQSVSNEELDRDEVLLTKQYEQLFIEGEPLVDRQLIAKLINGRVIEAKPMTSKESPQAAPVANQDIIAKDKDSQALSESLDSRSVLHNSQVNADGNKGSGVVSVLDSAVQLEAPKSDTSHGGQESSESRSQLLIKSETSSETNTASDTDKSTVAEVISKRVESNSQQTSDDLSEKSFLRTLNSAQLGIITEKVKDQNGFVGSSSDTTLEPTPLSGDTQFKVSQASFSQPQPNLTHNSTLSQEGIKSVTEQVLESIHASVRPVSTQITIRLNPPELGSVYVRFEQQQDEVTGLLQVSKAETRCEIEQALPQIVRSLADSGIQIRQLDVQLEDSPQRQADQEQLFQDGSYQRSFTREGDPDRQAPAEWFLSHDTQQDSSQPQLGRDSNFIDILV